MEACFICSSKPIYGSLDGKTMKYPLCEGCFKIFRKHVKILAKATGDCTIETGINEESSSDNYDCVVSHINKTQIRR